MIEKKLSRAHQINIEQCIKNAGGSKFDLVIQGAGRAREIAETNRYQGRIEGASPVVSALLEFQNNKINK